MPGGEEEYIRNLLVCKIARAKGKQHRTRPYEVAPVAKLLVPRNAAPWGLAPVHNSGCSWPCPHSSASSNAPFVWHSRGLCLGSTPR